MNMKVTVVKDKSRAGKIIWLMTTDNADAIKTAHETMNGKFTGKHMIISDSVFSEIVVFV